MRTSSLILIALGIGAAALMLGGIFILRDGGNGSSSPAVVEGPVVEEPEPDPTPQPPAPQPAPPRTTPRAAPTPAPQAATPAPVVETPSPVQPEAALPAEPPQVDWSQRVQHLLDSELDDTQISRQLVGFLGQAPPEEQGKIAEVMVSLMPDNQYAAVIPYLSNPTTTPEVLDVLMVDLLDRPETVQLPLFLDIARNPQHPRNAEAKDYLGLYMGQDYGTDWNAWQQAVQKHLQENQPE